MDPNNPVVKLCAAGMEAEFAGRLDDARALFAQAWEQSQDDYEACIAAHYVARHQPSFEENLRWNQESLARAEAVGDERVLDFYPSLLLNLGHSYEILGDEAKARKYYDLAVERVDALPPGPYGDVVRRGISAAQQRIGKQHEPQDIASGL